MVDLTHRRRKEEQMDAPDADPVLVQKSLRFIRRVNVLFGYTRATISHLERFSRNWKRGQTIRLLDVATGSADIPQAILRWADRRGWSMQVVGLDRHPLISAQAGSVNLDERLRIVRGDALNLPFADNTFDYALTNMFLHHLDDDHVVRVLQEMSRVSRRGLIAADLIRDRTSYRWIDLFTLLSNSMVRHDAKVSVGQAFTRDEMLALRDRADLGFMSYHRHLAYRFVLAGER
jgi:SAM-dependent methyltransferase